MAGFELVDEGCKIQARLRALPEERPGPLDHFAVRFRKRRGLARGACDDRRVSRHRTRPGWFSRVAEVLLRSQSNFIRRPHRSGGIGVDQRSRRALPRRLASRALFEGARSAIISCVSWLDRRLDEEM